MDPDPDPGGPKTYRSDGSAFGSGSATLVYTTNFIVKKSQIPPTKKNNLNSSVPDP
jgi:hypothetical protein